MINLNFGLFWSGAHLSYLRYLTFKTLRHFHPHSRIQLYISNKFLRNDRMGISQEFLSPEAIDKDYLSELEKLGVEVIYKDRFGSYAPNHQSDIFRYWFLKEHGGFYLDTDQIILKPFKLKLKNIDFLCSTYKVDSPYAFGGKFCPVGVLGADKKSKALKQIAGRLMEYYEPDNYNCIGPLMFADMFKKIDKTRMLNAPSDHFYPAPICDRVHDYFKGEAKFTKNNLSFHWFGGYGDSQKFNKAYTEEFAQQSNDTISKFLREKRII